MNPSHDNRSRSSSRGTATDPGAAACPARLGAQTPRSPLASSSPSPGTPMAPVLCSPLGSMCSMSSHHPSGSCGERGPTGHPHHPAQGVGHGAR